MVSELMLKYMVHIMPHDEMVTQWANDDMTIIVLNGGDQDGLEKIMLSLSMHADFPWAKFREVALNGALTAVGVVLPFEVWGKSKNEKYPEGLEYFEDFLENAQLAI